MDSLEHNLHVLVFTFYAYECNSEPNGNITGKVEQWRKEKIYESNKRHRWRFTIATISKRRTLIIYRSAAPDVDHVLQGSCRVDPKIVPPLIPVNFQIIIFIHPKMTGQMIKE